jgi:hypothetical protein
MAQTNKKLAPKAAVSAKQSKETKLEKRAEKFRRILRQVVSENAETLKALAK